MPSVISSQTVWLAARLAGAAAGFLFQFCLTRIMTPNDLGLFFSASSVATILGIVSTQGYPGVAARFVSRYAARGRDLWRTSFLAVSGRATIICALAISLAGIAAAGVWPGLDGLHRRTFVYASSSVPTIAALTALAAFGVAQRRFAAALLPDLLLRSASLAFFAGLSMYLGLNLNAGDAMLGFLCITSAIAALQAFLIRPSLSARRTFPSLSRRWRREAWTALTVMLFTSFFGDLAIVCATPFLATADVAAFGLSIKIAMVVGFGVQIAHQILLPDIADIQARRRTQDLVPVLLRGAAFPIAFAGAATLGTLLFGKLLLRLLYGVQFEHADGPLLLLVGCQLVRALAGPNHSVLNLKGRQVTNLAICSAAGCVLLAGNAVLTMPYGLWGAAVAATAAYIFWILAGTVVLRMQGDIGTDVVSLAHASTRRPRSRS